MNPENGVETKVINEETKQGVMDSLRTEHNGIKRTYKKNWLSIRLSLQINLMVWELIPFNDYQIMTSRQAFALRWLCFTLIGKKPMEVARFDHEKNLLIEKALDKAFPLGKIYSVPSQK